MAAAASTTGASLTRRNVVANLFGKLWTLVLGLVCPPLYVSILGIRAFGLVVFGIGLMQVVTVLDLGLSTTLNREMARIAVGWEGAVSDISARERAVREARNLLRTLEVLYWPISLFIVAVIVALAPFLSHHWLNSGGLSPQTVERSIMLMGLSLALQWPFSLYEGGLQGLQKQVLLNKIYVVTNTIQRAGVIPVLIASPHVETYFIWQLWTNALMTATVVFALWKSLPRLGERPVFEIASVRRLRAFVTGIAGNAVVQIILWQTDKVVLSHLLPLDVLGYYGLAGTVGGALWIGALPFYNALFPRFVQLRERVHHVELERLYHRGCQSVALIALPAAAVLVLFPQEVMRVWTGSAVKAAATAGVLPLLVIGWACTVLLAVPLALQLASGWTTLTFFENLGWAIFLAPLLLVMTKLQGAPGAALTWAIMNACHVAIIIPLMHRRLLPGEEIAWLRSDLLLPLAATLAVVVPARLLTPLLHSPLAIVPVVGTIWLLAICAALLAAPEMRKLAAARLGARA